MYITTDTEEIKTLIGQEKEIPFTSINCTE